MRTTSLRPSAVLKVYLLNRPGIPSSSYCGLSQFPSVHATVPWTSFLTNFLFMVITQKTMIVKFLLVLEEDNDPSKDMVSSFPGICLNMFCLFLDGSHYYYYYCYCFKKSTCLNHHRGLNDVENSNDVPLMKRFPPHA